MLEATPDLHLTLSLTHDCNLRCRYCYAGEKVPRHMPLEIGQKALELALPRARNRLHLVFFGGEPLLRWDDLVSLTGHAVAKGESRGVHVHPTVTTNGTLLTQERCHWLAEAHFVVAVSCDGIAEAHDANRVDSNAKGSFDLTWQGIQKLLTAGIKPRMVLVLHPSNSEFLAESIKKFIDAGLRDFVLNPDWSADWDAPGARETWSLAYDQLASLYVDAYRKDRPFWVSTLDSRIADRIRGVKSQDRCDMGRRNLVVAPSGNLYPCDRLIGNDDGVASMGHIDHGIDQARFDAFLNQAFQVPSACLTCVIRDRCRHRCACANLAMSGHPGTPTSLLCFHEQLCLRVADDAAEILFSEGNKGFFRQHYGSELISKELLLLPNST